MKCKLGWAFLPAEECDKANYFFATLFRRCSMANEVAMIYSSWGHVKYRMPIQWSRKF